jgi:hypothetical protein
MDSQKDATENLGSSRCYVAVEPVTFWFRAWYRPSDGTLDITRTGHLTKQCVIKDAEEQFGVSWREMYTKGVKVCGPGVVIRAIQCVVDLSPSDSKFTKST